jgi:hypothetical protein
MKILSRTAKALAAVSLVNLGLAQRAAAITDDDFNALKDLVIKQGQRLDQMQSVHEQDQRQIRDLQSQLSETRLAVTNAAAKMETMPVAPVAAAPIVPEATHNFMMAGDAEIQYGRVDGRHPGFELADFAPIFLYRTSDRVLFEAGLDVRLQNNAPSSPGASTAIDLSFAQLDYLANDYVTFVGGYMLLPLGTYTERGAGWLNKIPDDPLSRGILPAAGAGAQLRGALPVGQSGQMLTYSVFGANGPGSADGTDHASALDLGGNVGINSDGSTGNLHGSPGGGGRVGWFYPWKAHYDLELGVSGETGTWDNADRRRWSALVFDAAWHFSPNFEVKGEYMRTWVETGDFGTIFPRGWWVQTGYKLAGLNLNLPFINNLELIGRYDTVKDGIGTTINRYTTGYVYYLSNTLLFEGDYEFVHSNDPAQAMNRYVFQLSYGF